MGQQCCQGLHDEEPFMVKALHIKQEEFKHVEVDNSDPIIAECLQSFNQAGTEDQSAKVFKHNESDKYFFGDWQHGQACGQGAIYIPSRVVYQGNFINGMPNGEGEMRFLQRQESYKGSFNNGKAYGAGLYKNDKKKFTFEGSWINSIPEKGHLIFQDNKNISNIFVDNFQCGQAVIEYVDGRKYSGEVDVKSFVPDGQGTIYFPDKSFYIGGWKNGLMHGKGTYEWADGSKYHGSYVDGRKQGHGTFYYVGGKEYEGQWSNGKQEGAGKTISKDGTVLKEGIWKEGKFQRPIEASEVKIEFEEDKADRNQDMNFLNYEAKSQEQDRK